jgi:hypothetical protein
MPPAGYPAFQYLQSVRVRVIEMDSPPRYCTKGVHSSLAIGNLERIVKLFKLLARLTD